MYPVAILMKITENTQTGTNPAHLEELVWIADSVNNLNAFHPLYDKYYEAVYLFVYRRCYEKEDCLDLTSLVFEKAMMHIGKYKYQGYNFGSWLYAIARNVIADYFKKANRDAKLWVRDDGLMEMADNMESDIAKEENIGEIIKAIKKLPDSDRDLIVMKYFEKMSYEELAAIEKTNVNHMRVKLHRIIQHLKKIVERSVNQ